MKEASLCAFRHVTVDPLIDGDLDSKLLHLDGATVCTLLKICHSGD